MIPLCVTGPALVTQQQQQCVMVEHDTAWSAWLSTQACTGAVAMARNMFVLPLGQR